MDQSIHGSIVISCDQNLDCKSFIEKIMNTDTDTDTTHTDIDMNLKAQELSFSSNHSVKCYEWNIDNKYYSSKIHFFDLGTRNLVSIEFCNSVHAVIIYFDSSIESSFSAVKSWMPFLNEFELEIRLLVCDRITDTSTVTRICAQQWCIANQFELIELNESIEDSDTEFCGVNCVNGVNRIKQALQAYMWPNSVLKTSHQYTPSKKFKHLINNDIIDSIRCDAENSDQTDGLNTIECTDQCQHNIDSLNFGEMDSFEDLFTKFNDMKIRASLLNDSDRRVYAEKVALAFWKSIGGDDHCDDQCVDQCDDQSVDQCDDHCDDEPDANHVEVKDRD